MKSSMKNRLLFFCALYLTGLLSCPALAGAWGRQTNEFLLSSKLYRYQATKYWDHNSREKDIGATYDKKELNLYFEYGLGGDRTLVMQSAWDHITSGSGRAEGVSDLEISLIQKLREDGPQVLSAKALIIIPGSYPTDRVPLIGYGISGAELGLMLGRSFESWYLDSALSYRYYDGYPSDQLRGNLALGYDLIRTVRAKGELSAIYGLENGQPILINEIVIPPDYRLLQADLSLEFKLDPKLSMVLGYNQALSGRDTGVGSTFYFGCDLKN